MEKLEKILSPMANYLNNNKVIQAISKGIMSTMAALMVGACLLYTSFQVLQDANKTVSMAGGVPTNIICQSFWDSFASIGIIGSIRCV